MMCDFLVNAGVSKPLMHPITMALAKKLDRQFPGACAPSSAFLHSLAWYGFLSLLSRPSALTLTRPRAAGFFIDTECV